MSIVALKRKTQNQYNNMSVGSKQGFSLNGTHRSQGYVGQSTQSRFLSRTLMKGNVVKGHGGCCGTFNVGTIIKSSYLSTENPNVVKSSVLGTSGMIATQYRWIRRPQPFSTTKSDNNNNLNTQQQHIELVKKAAINHPDLSCNIVKSLDYTKTCKKDCNSSSTNYNYHNYDVKTDHNKTKIMHQSTYIEALGGKCANNPAMNQIIAPKKTQGVPFGCPNPNSDSLVNYEIMNGMSLTNNIPAPSISFVGTFSTTFNTMLPGYSVTCSSNGTYIAFCAFGAIFNSSNGGSSFTFTSLPSNNMYAITMSDSGQYQLAVSVLGTQAFIYISSNYGSSWTQKLSQTHSSTIYWDCVCMSSNGQYMYAGGTGGLTSLFSTNFGISWTGIGLTTYNRISSTMINSGKIFAIDSINNYVLSNNLNTLPTVPEAFIAGVVNGMNRITSDGGNIIIYVTVDNRFAYSTNGGISFLVGTAIVDTSPIIALSLSSNLAKLFAVTASGNLYFSKNLGVSWTKYIIAGSINGSVIGMTSSKDGNIMYILTTTASLYSYSVKYIT